MLTKAFLRKLKGKTAEEAWIEIKPQLTQGVNVLYPQMHCTDFEGKEVYKQIKWYVQDDGSYFIIIMDGGEGFLTKLESMTIGFFKEAPQKPGNKIFPVGILLGAKPVFTFNN